MGAQQIAAAISIVKHLPGQIMSSFGSFLSLLRPSKFVRLLLTPQHFTYGNNGMAADAATFVANLPAVKTALKGVE
jgi:cutinase